MDSPVQSRTRRAIMQAAIRVLGANRHASTQEVADVAEVSRSTVHRYFPDRQALVTAVSEFVEAEYHRLAELSRPSESSGREAFTRLAAEVVDHLDTFAWWFSLFADEGDGNDCAPQGEGDEKASMPADPSASASVADLKQLEQRDPAYLIVARGQEDGSIDSEMPQAWVVDLMWSLVYSAHAHLQSAAITQAEMREIFMRTLTKILTPPK